MKHLFILATAAFALASCSNNETVENDGPVELRLTSGIEVQARSNTQSTEILAGEKVYAWLDEVPVSGTATAFFNAWNLTAGASGALNGNPMFFPESGNGVNIYALHGNFSATFTEGTTAFPTSALVHTVEADQSPQSSSMENYAKSDLLYAVQKGVTRADASDKNVKTQALTFYHMLSKVEVALKSGSGTPGLDGATVTIENTKLKAAFIPAKDKDIAATADDAGLKARAAMITPATDGNDAQPVTIGNATTADFNSNPIYNEAIIVPQKVGNDNSPVNFIKVQLKDKAALYYQVTDLTLESGKKYTYHITVNLTGLTVTSTIDDWKAVGQPTDGNAEMQ